MPTVRHSLDPIFKPQAVAVVGASATPGSVGSILFHNLLANPFGGVVYPVNPKRKAVQGVRCYPDLAALPERPDLAVIATPAATVPGLVEQCAARGVPAAIVISAGFSELGAEGRKLEESIRTAARGMRIVGPNCLGVIHPPGNLNASFAASMARPGKVALLSQSGAICTSILDWAAAKHIGFSTFVSVGSMLDVDFADLIDYFGDDAATRSILLYTESVGDVRKFLSAARSVGRTKPVIVVKAGRHEAGARAAASHTGALAGSDAVFDAAFRRAGVLRVTTIPELFDMAEILALQPQPRGPALAIVTNAGGPGVMATDAFMFGGGKLAPLHADTLARLNTALPPYWSRANPIDILGDATPERYRLVVEACVEDPTVEGLLVLLTPQAMTDPTATARAVAAFAHAPGKPLLACWMGGLQVAAGREVLSAAGIPSFAAPESAVSAFLNMVQYRRAQELLYETPRALPEDWAPDRRSAEAVLQKARAAGRELLSESEAKEVLSAYGIPTAAAVECPTADDAVRAAERIGYPVVLKLLSPTITHKSDVGGVQLNLESAAGVRAAFDLIRANVARHGDPATFERPAGKGTVPLKQGDSPLSSQPLFAGVTVQPMIRDRGLELIVGSSIDRQFGPVILFGAGGVLVEVLQDGALALPPLNRTLARRLMERTRIYPALQGFRGQGPVDSDALETVLVRFSQLVTDLADVAEVDVNPLLASPQRIVALDARVLLCAAAAPRPRLAVQPYPNQYTAPFTLRGGERITVRAIQPEDEPLILAMHGRHSEHTIRMRFFSLVKVLSHDSLVRLCHLDYDREMGLIAVAHRAGEPVCLGVSRYYMSRADGSAEFALVVDDGCHRQGLGRHLLGRLLAIAREHGVRHLVGLVLAENGPMLSLTRSLGFRPEETPDGGVVRMVRDL